jgi:DNA polymerase I-like protein with 3'-5' exonuclease and polymerase domains
VQGFTWKIIHTVEEWNEAIKDYKEGTPVACDVETYKQDPKEGKLLGVSVSFRIHSSAQRALYVPFMGYDTVLASWSNGSNRHLQECVLSWVRGQSLVGHNFTYDKKWLPQTTWIADTRIMWHMASAPAGPRPYSLKDLQVELLGWDTKGDKELKEQVESRGGKLSNGDHYLADVEVLAKYACLDTYSTLLGYEKLSLFFDHYDYWPLLHSMMAYNELLELNTTLGIRCDEEGLQKANKRLLGAKEAAHKRLNKQLAGVVDSLEQDWLDRKLAAYKRDYNRKRLLEHPEDWRRFNWNSDKDKRELFYDKLQNPVIYTTESGLPSVNADSVRQMKGVWVESYLKYEKSNTLTSSFTKPWLGCLKSGRIHPGFNICGTVSYRLSGFKPYFLNPPFDEKYIMKHFKCDEGMIGVHADLAAIEPTITAHYSEDPALIKVFGKGLGDIYLDLAKELLPRDKELQEGYNPQAPITAEIKERFARQRKIAKVIQLAVQYTGTGKTVAKNLTKNGIPTTVEEADGYVRAYWKKFRKVSEFNYQLRELYRKQGYLRNVIGRIIRVPDPDYKDLSNRVIQSSAHDVLVLWVLEIYRLHAERGLVIKPVILDCHDSTSCQVPKGQERITKRIFQEALDNINKQLDLTVWAKCEIKTFQTLAGLKATEDILE